MREQQPQTAGRIRKCLKKGKPTIGSWLQLPSPDVAEVLAQAGYEWLAVDMEHGSFGPETLPNVFRAIECAGAVPFARLPEASKVWIKQALEAGAQGLIFPMIESAAQLAAAIDLATYPGHNNWHEPGQITPMRGVGFCRANGFGKYFDDYRENVARELVLVAQIEHIDAVNDIEAIISHPRLDAILVGPYDLSGSMGITGQFDNPKFQQAMDKIASACRKTGMAMGCHVVTPSPAALQRELERGALFVAYGIDTVFLWQAAQKPAIARTSSCA